MDFIIRRANLDDVKNCNNFLTLLIRDEKNYDKNINENCKVNIFYENFISNENNCILIAQVEDDIVGYLYGFIKNNGDTYIDLVAQLDAMFIDESFRKYGIGTSLINEFKKWSIEHKVKQIELQVCNENDKAISLYKKNGFKNIKSIMSIEL